MSVAGDRDVRQRTMAKARVLLEALPYIREHWGRVVVVKLGGAAMTEPALAATFAKDIALLRFAGVRPVVVHGGGPQISELSQRLGLETRFEQGLRVTDEDTLAVSRLVLLGEINPQIVAAIDREGVPAVGVSGDDARLLTAVRLPEDDLGFVGRIDEVVPAILNRLLEWSVPVVASTASTREGQPLNVNADETAAAIAAALGAEKLVYLTDVAGLYEPHDGIRELLSELSVDECRHFVEAGAIEGGMLPKLQGIVRAMDAGVARAHILDGRVRHALILELFTPEGLGTMVTRDGVILPREVG